MAELLIMRYAKELDWAYKEKKHTFEDSSPVAFLLLRDKLGLKRYRKHDYLLIEKKRRRLKVG